MTRWRSAAFPSKEYVIEASWPKGYLLTEYQAGAKVGKLYMNVSQHALFLNKLEQMGFDVIVVKVELHSAKTKKSPAWGRSL